MTPSPLFLINISFQVEKGFTCLLISQTKSPAEIKTSLNIECNLSSCDSGYRRGIQFLALPSFRPVEQPAEKAQARSRKKEFGLPFVISSAPFVLVTEHGWAGRSRTNELKPSPSTLFLTKR